LADEGDQVVWSYPEMVRLGIASFLGVARALIEVLRTKTIDFSKLKLYYGNAKLGIFDVISPRWTSLHTTEEVISWFTSQGFKVKRLAPCYYIGVKRILNKA
jgi:hypothetical protein